MRIRLYNNDTTFVLGAGCMTVVEFSYNKVSERVSNTFQRVVGIRIKSL